MKNNDSFKNWLIGVGIVFICLLSVFVFRQKAICSSMALGGKDIDIASIINGLTAPVIGIATTILLYITLNKQRESNLLTSQKNEIETFFVLFEDLKSTYHSFLFQHRDNTGREEYGLTAFKCFGQELKNFKSSIIENGTRLKDFNSIYYILSIINTYEILFEYVNTLNDGKTKKLAEQKLFDFYELYLNRQLNDIIEIYTSIFSGEDSILDTIKAFIEKIKGSNYGIPWLFDAPGKISDNFIVNAIL